MSLNKSLYEQTELCVHRKIDPVESIRWDNGKVSRNNEIRRNGTFGEGNPSNQNINNQQSCDDKK
jgi:hypothetical protein